MNINSFFNYSISFFKESIKPSLTAQQKKILMIVSVALGFLAAVCAIKRYLIPNKFSTEEQIDKDPLNGQGKIIYPENEDSELGNHSWKDKRVITVSIKPYKPFDINVSYGQKILFDRCIQYYWKGFIKDDMEYVLESFPKDKEIAITSKDFDDMYPYFLRIIGYRSSSSDLQSLLKMRIVDEAEIPQNQFEV